ncbi:MAG TPA: YqeG family HAD IIIA-type phosphatase [Candidatus Dormibacteraeota bacterium]|nr:YqeG family HAD IIIA-type phosphatase [Candidatus Dormibacteraeota bacterium]
MLSSIRQFHTLSTIPLQLFEELGVRGLILDLDNTLLGFGAAMPSEENCAWIAAARGAGLEIVLLSNNFAPRVAQIAAALGLRGIPNALKPLPVGFLRAKRALAMRSRCIAVIGDQLFTDVLGARLCGMQAVLVDPIEDRDFLLTRLFRRLERIVLPSRRV